MCLLRNPVGNAGFCFSRWPNPPGSFLQQQQELKLRLSKTCCWKISNLELEKLFARPRCQRIITALKAEKISRDNTILAEKTTDRKTGALFLSNGFRQSVEIFRVIHV